MATAGAKLTRGAFARAVMDRLNVPFSPRNRRAFQAWIQSEGGEAANNPLNTTFFMGGSSIYNAIGVRNFASPGDGITATVRTFHEQGHGYEPILYHLRHDSPAYKTLRAVGKSDWGTTGDLALQIRSELVRFPGYLRQLEQREVAG